MSVLIVGLVNPSVRTQLFMKGLTIGNMLMDRSEWNIVLPNGISADADEEQEPISDEIYYIVVDKCTEWGFHEEPQCVAVCPVDCCVDEDQKQKKNCWQNNAYA